MIPFLKSDQLIFDLEPDGITNLEHATVPGRPMLNLRDYVGVRKWLANELVCCDLESIAPQLWIMTTMSSANINSLHRQRIRGRDIIVTEDPRLHLIWNHDRIFIKPIPLCLLSHEFWRMYLHKDSGQLGGQQSLRKAALGFLRTYLYLIQHESDLWIAQQDHLRLIPKDINWKSLCRFTSALNQIEDLDVSGRYHYGEIRLTRLNLYAPFLLRKFYYEPVHGQYSDFFGRLFSPVLFVLAIISIMLNSMQVELAVEQLTVTPWESFWLVSRCFSIMSLIGVTLIAAWLAFLWLWMLLDECLYTVRRKRERSHRQ